MSEFYSDKNPCRGHQSVFSVEMRKNMGVIWDCDLAFVGSTLERAEQFCRDNSEYDKHDPAMPWLFAIAEEKVDCDNPVWSTHLVCYYDWDGNRHDEDCPAYFLETAPAV
jgi:hypothetical protein